MLFILTYYYFDYVYNLTVYYNISLDLFYYLNLYSNFDTFYLYDTTTIFHLS